MSGRLIERTETVYGSMWCVRPANTSIATAACEALRQATKGRQGAKREAYFFCLVRQDGATEEEKIILTLQDIAATVQASVNEEAGDPGLLLAASWS